MKKQILADSKADDFLLRHLQRDIYPFGNNHRDKLGYTRVFVNEDWIIDSIKFIEGTFNKKPFRKMNSETVAIQGDDNFESAENLYFEILYGATKTKIMFYTTSVLFSTMDYSKFKSKG